MLRFLFNRYKKQFEDMLVEEFYGSIPASLREPSIEFLAQNKNTLERFFTIQAYIVQRRAVGDIKNAEVYKGVLIHIKSLLLVVSRAKVVVKDSTIETDKEKPEDGIMDFLSKAKAKFLKQ